MLPLEEDQRIFTWFGICSVEKSVFHNAKTLCTVLNVINYAYQVLIFGASVLYFFKFISIDLVEALNSLHQTVGLFGVLYSLTVALLYRTEIRSIFSKYQQFYDEYEHEESFIYVVQANERANRITRFYIDYIVRGILVSFVFDIMGCILFSLLKDGYINETYFIYPTRFESPWNEKTLYGWIGMIICTIFTAGFYYITNGMFLFFFFGICEHNQAFCQQFHAMLNDFNGSGVNYQTTKTKLCELVNFHVLVRDLFEDTADVMAKFLLMQIIPSMVIVSCCILQFELQNLDFNMFNLLAAFLTITLNLFFYCYYGGKSTESFLRMADSLFESKWHALPTHFQKYYLLQIVGAQRPLFYHGFYIVNLNLETFQKIFKMIIRYYLMFKTLTTE